MVKRTERKFEMNNQLGGEKINIFLKEKANRLLEDIDFLESWAQLEKDNTIKSSIFQKPGFLIRWFRAKRNEFSPIILAEYEENRLKALLILAIDIDEIESPSKKTKIIGAGEYDAEYQGFLCSHDQPLTFLEEAVGKVFLQFPRAQVSIRFFLDSKFVGELKKNPKLKKWLTIQEFTRPIAELQTPDLDKILRKRHLKAKINRFKRAGNAELEVIHKKERLVEVLPRVMLLYDFRQGALFNKYPSTKFMNESPLFVELLDSGAMHFSLLKLDGEVTSCIVCYHNDSWVHLAGMITYSPFFAKLSPGLVHIYLLSEKLRAEGFEFFDLTPGYDGYKDKFATSNDVVFELTFSSNQTSKISKKGKIIFHDYLVGKGIRPMSFDLEIKRKKYLLERKTKGIIRLAGKLILPAKKIKELDRVSFKKNSIEALFNFQEEGMLTKWEFLEDAFAKVEEGFNFTTATLDGKLLSCIWFMDTTTEGNGNEHTSTKPIPQLKASYFSRSIITQKREIVDKAINLV
jgi:hypothetical protein